MLQPIYYSILADEVTSDNEEHLAICARFVDEKKDVREELLTFIKLERITGEKIAENILAFLKENNVPVTNMRVHCNGHACSLQWTRMSTTMDTASTL